MLQCINWTTTVPVCFVVDQHLTNHQLVFAFLTHKVTVSSHCLCFTLTLWFCDSVSPPSFMLQPLSLLNCWFSSPGPLNHTHADTHSHTMRAWLISVSPLVSVKCQNKKGHLKGTSNPNYVELKTALDTSSCRTGGGRVKGGMKGWTLLNIHE